MADRYRRLDEGALQGAIARGSYGKVYAAVDLESLATVAVKRQEFPSNTTTNELCFYKALSQAKHDHVMHLRDHFIDKGRYLYMVFDFMDTTLWRRWTMRRRMLPSAMAIRFVTHAVSGVAHLHELGIVHTDLSMANMLVGSGDILRICDLGGAANAYDMVLAAGKEITTEYVRAPEVLLGTRHPTLAVDLWALGVVTMALLSGSLVFWRMPCLEPRVNGLLSPTYGLEPSEKGQPRHADIADLLSPVRRACKSGVATLANQVAFLGPIYEDVWPGCGRLPGFKDMGPIIQNAPLRPTPAEFLADASLVRRALAITDLGSSFILQLLIWGPSKRLGAKSCIEHELLKRPNEASAVARTLVAVMSPQQLRDVVLQSLTSGKPVTMESICPVPHDAAPPSPKRARVATTSPKEAKEKSLAGGPPQEPTGANSCAPKLTQAMALHHRRMRVKTSHPIFTAASSQQKLFAPAPGQAASSQSDSKIQPSGPASGQAEPMASSQAGSQIASSGPMVANQADSQTIDPPHTTFQCRCRGNCGQSACKRRKNYFSRRKASERYCLRVAAHGESFCMFCKCEKCSSGRQGTHGQGRWCNGCAKSVLQVSSSPLLCYHNVSGTHRVDASWSPALRLTARFAYATTRVTGSEEAYWAGFVDALLKWRCVSSVRMLMEPGDWMFLCVMACVKWPYVVSEAFSLLQDLEPRTATAVQWYGYLIRLLGHASGRCWKSMHDAISPGRSRCNFGLVWFCKHMGVIAKIMPGTECSGALALGVSQLPYTLGDEASSQGKLQAMMDGIQCKPLAFPTTCTSETLASSQAIRFGTSVSELCSHIVGPDSELARGYVGRKLLCLLQREWGPSAWDNITMQDLQAWLPDQNGHCESLGKCRGEEVRKRFGMSPVSVSGVACMWGVVNKKHLPALDDAGATEVLNAITRHMDETASSQEPASSQQLASTAEPASSRLRAKSLLAPYGPAPHEWVATLWAKVTQADDQIAGI